VRLRYVSGIGTMAAGFNTYAICTDSPDVGVDF
jgi:hypothetical protein